MPPEERPLLLLWGFMGTGKTTLGRAVAARVRTPFVDLDEQIAAASGVTVAAIFRDEGEAGFRAREREALATLLEDMPRGVIALGGGALCDDDTRRLALERAFVVTLAARAATIAERTRGGDRPLLQRPDPRAAIDRLLLERAALYRDTHARLATDDRAVDELVEALLALWRGVTEG